MKNFLLPLSALALVLASAGCAKKMPIATSPNKVDTTPVAQAPAQPAPAKQLAPRQQPAAAPTRAATAPPAQQRTPQAVIDSLNAKLARLEDALFDYDKATIRTDASSALKDDVGVIRDILAAYPNQKLLIEGHADERGSQEYNLALGDRRARAAEEFLSSMGIPTNQLTVISYGKERPVCTEESESCYQRNRRAHMTAAQ
ncbi:MAG TPA: OmpA family protein [Bryobacteraceae bacterium]|jgi:peptidoglycan-associated lipoprotein